MSIYLYANAALYLLFAALCTLNPWGTASGVGYIGLSAGGRSEYLVVYGGLQLGLALIFATLARGDYPTQRLGILCALCLYAPIVVYRLTSVVRYWPVAGMTVAVGTLEILLLVAALVLRLRST